MRQSVHTFVDQLRSLARTENPEAIREELDGIHAADLASGLQRLEIDEGIAILSALDSELAGDILTELPTETARKLVNELPDVVVAHYLDVLPMDDAIELREELGEERFDGLLHLIPVEDRMEIRRLMTYPEGSAGRLMTESYFAANADTTMAEILHEIRTSEEGRYETVNDIYVVDDDRHLLGVFSLRQAVRADLADTAREVMSDEVVAVAGDTPAETVARQIARYGFYAMPILDERGRLVGIFTVDDAQSTLSDAETEDVLKMGGVTGDVESYLSLDVWQLAKRRIPWLMVLFVAETLTGSVMRHYGLDTDQPVTTFAKLTFFVPLLIGAGGNSGSQTTTMITRALAVGEVTPSDWLVVVRREFMTALLIGFALGVIGFARALLWGTDMGIAGVVGTALPAIVLWATCIGGMLPLAAKRIGIDPALMSAPFISTFVDATGLVIYFEIAHLFLKV